ncbi:MAG: glycosyl hydrolase family 88 [Oscillospiraceae bacterium]|nr:glycosyl hydrolase family 88 [Oscillospiraceae bacterium]
MRRDRKVIRLVSFLMACIMVVGLCGCNNRMKKSDYRTKADLLKSQVVTRELEQKLGSSPALTVNHVVFLSVCDKTQRAVVFTGVGKTLEEAWDNADAKAEAALKESGMEPVWLKADVVFAAETVDQKSLDKMILASRHEFFRYGLAFDENYETALLEAELNGAKIYEYEEGGIDFSYLNTYLKKAGRTKLEALPESYVLFRCLGWFCDENLQVYELYAEGLEYGRRKMEKMDGEYAKMLVKNAADFLVNQVLDDGSFVYGMYPRFDNDIENYNIVRHASTLWSLVCRYRMEPSDELEKIIDSAFAYMLTQIIYDGENTAYLYEAKNDEIKLGANGVAIIAMTEYMDAFGNDKYVKICRKLGNGILTMLDQDTGEYYHVLNGDFTRKEEFRTVYYDGEATFGLCRLYSVTGEDIWLDAAVSAVDHFIAADYTQHKDHWIAYSMNEITKHVPKEEYYEFAMRNVQVNLETIYQRDTTYHTYLELLMVSFELYDRICQSGVQVENLDLDMFLKTIYTRANRQLDGYFYPEYAMYMKNPQRVLNTFMVRHDGYRIRIDDVQHNIGGLYLYYKNYDKLVEYGMLDAIA